MSKKKQKSKKSKADAERSTPGSVVSAPVPGGPPPKMKEKEYRRELRRLHGELVAMQEWVKSSGTKVCIVFEGRDTAGKGGTIKAITERVRRVHSVSSRSRHRPNGKSRRLRAALHGALPGRGEVVIFDRSWYNRAGVERVMGFCTPEQVERFLAWTPGVEQAMVDAGIILVKYWLEVSPDEQTRRLESRIDDPRKVWKLSDMDLTSYTMWDEYSRARDDMLMATDSEWAPWFVAHSDDKKRARLNVIAHLLTRVPYTPLKPQKVTLPKRKIHAADLTGTTVRFVPRATELIVRSSNRHAGGDAAMSDTAMRSRAGAGCSPSSR